MRRPTTFVLALLFSAAFARAARAQDNGGPVEGSDSGDAQPSMKVIVEPTTASPAPAAAPPAAKPAAKRRKHPAVRKAKPKKAAAPVVTPDPGVKKPAAAPAAPPAAPAVPVTQVQPWNP
jgi:hypothetical protein